jgi:hypothetical protein
MVDRDVEGCGARLLLEVEKVRDKGEDDEIGDEGGKTGGRAPLVGLPRGECEGTKDGGHVDVLKQIRLFDGDLIDESTQAYVSSPRRFQTRVVVCKRARRSFACERDIGGQIRRNRRASARKKVGNSHFLQANGWQWNTELY